MDGGDGWHVAGSGTSGHDKTIINRIMLRFRPIAPKPAAEGSSSVMISPENKNGHFTSNRVKRKYIRVAKKNNNSSGKRFINSSSSTGDKPEVGLDSAVVTLQLMPEKTGSQDFQGIDPTIAKRPENKSELPTWMRLNPNGSIRHEGLAAAGGTDRTVVESWVTVESVTDTCMDVRGLGSTDVEKLRSLDKDTCPGFISDGYNKVKWVNEAYRRMVGQGESLPEVAVVRLLLKADLPVNMYPAFSCRVRVQYYTWQKEKCSKMVPCDVWRMEGGLAWRLDIKAALSLGL